MVDDLHAQLEPGLAQALLGYLNFSDGRPDPRWQKQLNDAFAHLNDFVGHRPVAILETRPQGEPYEHERHRPLPLYLKGAGVAFGRYHDVVEKALEILRETDRGLLQEASFGLDQLEELALD